MGEYLYKLRFLTVHMLQYELLFMFLVTAGLLWVLNLKLSGYSTKTREAKVARLAALMWLGVLGLIALLGRVLLR